MKKLLLAFSVFFVFGILFKLTADFSQQEVELKFSHKFHIEEQEIECGDCHQAALTSTSGKDNLFPTMEVCADCHDVEDDETCNICHQDIDEPREVPRIETFSEKFSHKVHLDNNLECATCHAAVAKKTSAEPFILPSMIECMDCHESKQASVECAACHMPGDQLIPASHTKDFIHNHSDLAQANAKTMTLDLSCMSCHQQSYCQDCHEDDNLERRTHPLNYQFTHALAAQGKERECASCHVERSFCISCHRDNQILPHNHKPGWVNQISGGRHRLEALNDLENCMACHEQNAEQICQPCHGK